MLGWPPTWSRLLLLPAIFLGFTVHELAHAWVAYLLGDTSQVERRRLTFNPLRHVSAVGLVAFLLIGVGWAKPVSVDHSRFRLRNQTMGLFLVSVSGVTANLLTALLALLGMSATIYLVFVLTGAPLTSVFQYLVSPTAGLDAHGLVVALSYYMFSVNLVLGLFNLLPIPPLDGFLALMSLSELAAGALKRKPRSAGLPVRAAAPQRGGEPALGPAQIHLEIGLEYHAQGQLDEAIARYRQAIGQGEGSGLAYYNMGAAFWGKGRLDQAESAFKSAIQPHGDPHVRAQAAERLRELARAGQGPGAIPPPPPPFLGPGEAAQEASPAPAPLDPSIKRRLWLRLALGGAALVLLAGSAWMFVTLATYAAFVPH